MKIAVLLSGGVDSSVALNLLKEEGGHELSAYYLKIWLEDELAYLGDCPWEEDLSYAREVCERAGVPLHIISLQTEYLDKVVGYALRELKAGRTPSPDIFCNQRIKYGEFFTRLDDSYHKVASGHYAAVEQVESRFVLKTAADPIKDQTYFLSHLSQAQLGRALFPLGRYTKAEVRTLADSMNLPNKDRKDSQGICFLGKIQYRDFVKFHLGERSGPIKELGSGRVLGEHQGFWFYTIGQRQGLGLSGGPWFVAQKDTEQNIVYVTHGTRLTGRAKLSLTVADGHWIDAAPLASDQIRVKLRHGPASTACRLLPLGGKRWWLRMEQGDTGIASGQFAIFYSADLCLGGGIIE